MKKINIYLCDFVHNYASAGSYVFPLNIGYLAAYLLKYSKLDLKIELFKYPLEFINAFNKKKCDIVGFSNYTWNFDINMRISKYVKKRDSNIITVAGGPNIDYSDKGYRVYFKKNKNIDFYVIYQGEKTFNNLVKKIVDNKFNIELIKKKSIDGVIFYYKNQIILGKKPDRIKNPDRIPSPYLSGILDKFFGYKLIPIMEASRGCPYQCIFCAQGLSAYHSVEFFSLSRIKKELNYIALKVKHTNLLAFADANFGITKNYVKIADFINDIQDRYSYPRKCILNWAKNQKEILDLAKKINKSSRLVISLQSLDPKVLKEVKRKNISISIFKKIVKEINVHGGTSGTEIILGLPGENLKSHLNTLRKLFDWNVSYIIGYNGLLIKGTEMSIEEYDLKTKYRLIDSSFGKYKNILSFETEQGIMQNKEMNEEELLSIRPVHWLVQFLWDYKFYHELLLYLRQLNVNPLDLILKVINDYKKAPLKVQKIFNEFFYEAKSEWFDTPDDLRKFYSKKENFVKLKKGQFGKLNGKYTWRVLLECRKDFEKYLFKISGSFVDKKQSLILKNVLKYNSEKIIDFSKELSDIRKEKNVDFKYDILNYNFNQLSKKNNFINKKITYKYFLSDKQKLSLDILLKQYNHKNKNLVLRKMSEYMNIDDLFYSVNNISGV